MMKISAALTLYVCVSPALAIDCDCTTYPFTPNPPCYGHCVAKLSSTKGMELLSVKNIDPGVSVGIRVLAGEKNKASVDFNGIRGKVDLERAALKSLEGRRLLEASK